MRFSIFAQIISLEDVRVDASAKTLYIVMELMECNLYRVLASGQILTAEHAKVLLKQLLLGVQAMHRLGLIREFIFMFLAHLAVGIVLACNLVFDHV